MRHMSCNLRQSENIVLSTCYIIIDPFIEYLYLLLGVLGTGFDNLTLYFSEFGHFFLLLEKQFFLFNIIHASWFILLFLAVTDKNENLQKVELTYLLIEF
jgi:hypothetical protein